MSSLQNQKKKKITVLFYVTYFDLDDFSQQDKV